MSDIDQPIPYDLSGFWSLVDETGDYDTQIMFPGDGITALQTAGLIADPYWGKNEYDLRWISEREWTARRSIDLDDTDYALVLSFVDTIATVRLNGQTVGHTENHFREYRFDLSKHARIGTNDLEITFPSSVKHAQRLQDSQPFFVPFIAINTPIPNGNMLRKPHCDFGWDWNVALAPFGIYGDIRLEPLANDRFNVLKISQSHSTDLVVLTIQGEVTSSQKKLNFDIHFAGQTESGSIDLQDGQGVFSATFEVTNPELWYPVGLGPQTLHELRVTVGTATETRRIGLRQIELVNEQSEKGLGFKFRVNGHDTFAKGTNWVPADALAGRITPGATRDLLQSAVDANMNMVRVWGGGRYEPTWFYDLCDELGLMVWQDFMFACSLYPSTPDFLSEVSEEITETVNRLHHHACLALWCGDNELIGALDWFPESRDNRDRYLASYDRLNHTLETALKAAEPDANWWPSSPSPGPMSFGDAWHDDSSGDMHFWSVWHEGKDFEHYRDVSPRFCSEFGFQSYPSMNVIRRFADERDFNIASPVMESHQKSTRGNARIAETMFRYFRFPVDFENFVYLSQIQQGLAIKTAITHWRSLKPHCMGTLIWQLNDTWPVCSWSSLDHGGGWKLLHHMAKHFYAPVTVAVQPTADAYKLVAVNDTRHPVSVHVDIFALSVSGTLRSLGDSMVTVTPDAAEPIIAIPTDALMEQEMLWFRWSDENGATQQECFAPQRFKSYDLQPANIQLSVEKTTQGYELTLSAEKPAFFTAVESSTSGRFSNNAFTLLPEDPTTITFVPDTPGPTPDFVVRDLHSATYSSSG